MAKQERVLTPAETVRKERFDALCREMAEAGYEKTDLTVGIVFANVASIFLMLPFAAALWVSYVLVNPSGRARWFFWCFCSCSPWSTRASTA